MDVDEREDESIDQTEARAALQGSLLEKLWAIREKDSKEARGEESSTTHTMYHRTVRAREDSQARDRQIREANGAVPLMPKELTVEAAVSSGTANVMTSVPEDEVNSKMRLTRR